MVAPLYLMNKQFFKLEKFLKEAQFYSTETTIAREINMFLFYWKLSTRLDWLTENPQLSRGYREVAQIWMASLPDIFFIPLSHLTDKETAIIPLFANESARFLKIMSTCETGYLDTRQNIADLLPYLNDKVEKSVN